jgi:hypothetical protein
MLVGSKIDLEKRREIQKKKEIKLANKLGGSFWEVSALTGHGTYKIF